MKMDKYEITVGSYAYALCSCSKTMEIITKKTLKMILIDCKGVPTIILIWHEYWCDKTLLYCFNFPEKCNILKIILTCDWIQCTPSYVCFSKYWMPYWKRGFWHYILAQLTANNPLVFLKVEMTLQRRSLSDWYCFSVKLERGRTVEKSKFSRKSMACWLLHNIRIINLFLRSLSESGRNTVRNWLKFWNLFCSRVMFLFARDHEDQRVSFT